MAFLLLRRQSVPVKHRQNYREDQPNPIEEQPLASQGSGLASCPCQKP